MGTKEVYRGGGMCDEHFFTFICTYHSLHLEADV